MKRLKFSLRTLLLTPIAVFCLCFLLTPHASVCSGRGSVPYAVWYRPLVVREVMVGKEQGAWLVEVYWTGNTSVPWAVVLEKNRPVYIQRAR